MRAAREVVTEYFAGCHNHGYAPDFDRLSDWLREAGWQFARIEPSEKMRMEAWNAWVEMWPSVEPLSQAFFDGVYRAHLKASLSEG